MEIVSKEPVLKAQESAVSYKRSLIIGMLLGNALGQILPPFGKQLRAELVVSHRLRQEDLLCWKAEEISRLFDMRINIRKAHQNKKVGFSVTKGKRIRVICGWFDQNGKKIISDKIRFMNHPVGVSMLLCDAGFIQRRKKQHQDGSIYFSAPVIKIAMNAFSEDDIERFLNHIKASCGAKGNLRKNGAYRDIFFNAENSKMLWYYVSPWIPKVPSMSDKFRFMIERYGMKQSDDTAGT